jgi:hypothetical protein
MKQKGLLLKDIYELWGQAKTVLILIAVFLLLGSAGTGFSGIGLLLCAMLPTNCIGYDERAKWNRYALSMPLSVRDIVFSKYLLGYLGLAVGVLVKVLSMFLPFSTGGWNSLLLTLSVALLYLALQLPILFRCGLESGRIWMMLISVFFAVAVTFLGEMSMVPELELGKYSWVLLVLAILLQIPSIALSVRLFRSR